jgi:hypothetical protein
MKYREQFFKEILQRRTSRLPLLTELLNSKKSYLALVEETIPGFSHFHHLVSKMMDINKVVDTGVIQKLLHEKLAKSKTEYITSRKLTSSNGLRAWQFDWLYEGGLHVDRSDLLPKCAERLNHVELVVKVNRDKKIIDTEFYSKNPSIGQFENSFDDREKFHIVWQANNETDNPFTLKYAGLGANQPFESTHPEIDSTESGRPRFYIYDALDKNRIMKHPVRWKPIGSFDWDWEKTSFTPRKCGSAWILTYLKWPGDQLYCLSDPNIFNACKSMDKDYIASLVLRIFNFENPLLKFDELEVGLQNEILNQFWILEAYCESATISNLPIHAPTPQEVMDKATCDYEPYFVAYCGAGVANRTLAEIIQIVNRMDVGRASEYDKIFKTKCEDLFEDIGDKIPALMGQLFEIDLSEVSTQEKEMILQWRSRIINEINMDIYFYGQQPAERISSLWLGYSLATSPKYGNLYSKVLNEARNCILGVSVRNQTYDIVLPFTNYPN